MIWTPEQIKRLRALHAEEMSARQIGAEFGCNRNAVLGKLHRLGLSNPFTQKERAARYPKRLGFHDALFGKKSIGAPVAPTRLPPPRSAPAVEPTSRRLSLLDLTSDTCRWPLGEPGHFHFCGHKPSRGPFCAFHARIAYQPEGRRVRWLEPRA